MGRKKLKYRDVVHGSKGKGGNKNKSKKPPRPRKTYSLYKQDNNNKRKQSSESYSKHKTQSKKFKQEEVPPPKVVESSSSDSESEEEAADAMQQLRATFGIIKNKVSQAIDSESDSESDTEVPEDNNETVSGQKSDNETDSSLDTSEDEVHNISVKSKEQEESEDSHSDDNIEIEVQKEDEDVDNLKDPFVKHLFYELHSDLLESLESIPVSANIFQESWPKLGNLLISIPKCDKIEDSEKTKLNEKNVYAPPGEVPQKISTKNMSPIDLHIKSQIIPNISFANTSASQSEKTYFTPFQSELFSIINNYQDFYYPERTFDNAPDIRFTYCLHAVNHILKTRLKVLHHNARLSKKDEVPEDFRDQGLVRPKVLIVVPFKDSAYKIVDTIIKIMFKEDHGNVIKKNRFNEDYTGNELYLPKKNPKPEDYEQTFCGNTSDDFRIGITVTKKSLKLYADFYSSDIIIASPLGLRTAIGAEGEAERDYDFLASIELLIFDQTEIFLMQNWDHVYHILNHLHLKPKDLHGTDISRVRQWSLNFWAKYYRQTLIFSSIVLPEINSIFNTKCMNYAGKVKVVNPVEFGSINKIFVQVPHVFHQFDAKSPLDSVEARFECFINKILPQQKDSVMKQTMVFVPSYFDYVRIRNYFKKEDVGFVQICEYSKEAKIARARDMFYHGDAHFLLYTERYHYFNRIRVKGIRHLVFYQLPNFPHFYYELCNLMQEINMNKKVGSMLNMTVTVIYSKYDSLQLAGVVGTERAAKMLQSDRKVHMMVTGSD